MGYPFVTEVGFGDLKYNTILSMGGRSCSKHALNVVSDDVLCAEGTCNEYPLELGDKMGLLMSP